MERMGPIRPNVINRWTLFQAKEHPDQYDLDDGIVVVKGDDEKTKKIKAVVLELFDAILRVKYCIVIVLLFIWGISQIRLLNWYQ